MIHDVFWPIANFFLLIKVTKKKKRERRRKSKLGKRNVEKEKIIEDKRNSRLRLINVFTRLASANKTTKISTEPRKI